MGSAGRMVLLTFLIAFQPTIHVLGQQTTVHGTITDSATGDPLPYANISFVGSAKGTSSDANGNYELSGVIRSDSIRFSLMGYRTRTFAIEVGETQELNVTLAPKSVEFSSVEIRPKERENPAHPIIRKVLEKKSQNRPSSIRHYEYRSYNKLSIGMGVKEGVREKWWLQPIRFVFDNVDSSGAEPYLPIFISETVSKIHYRESPQAKKEHIEAARTSGLENPTVTKYMGNMYQEVEIYENNIHLFDKSFKSPIANGAFAFYEYYLMDTIKVDSSTCFKIRFKPKRKHESTFQGDLFIEDSSFAIKKLDIKISEGANINYIDELSIRQEFHRFEKEYWMLTKNDVDIEASVLIPHNMRWQDFYAHKATYYEDFAFDGEAPDSIYTSTDDISMETLGPGTKDSTEKGEAYWREERPVALTENEEAVFEMTDSIKQMPHYKFVRSLIRGYADAGPIEIGPFFTMYSFNSIEGNRFRLGFRTDDALGGKMNLSSYGAYGLKDENFKYAGRAKYFFQRQPTWEYLGLSYQKDLQQLGIGQNLLENDNILNSTFRRRQANRLNSLESFRIYYKKEWPIGLSTRLEARNRILKPRGILEFQKPTDNGEMEEVNAVRTTELSLSTHFAFKEKFYTTSYRRFSLGSNYPLIDLNYSYGFDEFLGSDYGYQKLIGRLSHRVRLGVPGTFQYRVEAGKYWGALPYPLLELHDGNETYFLNPSAFNMMNYYEFVSDQYASLFLTHHFNGLFFDHIPLLRKLNLRTVVSGKAVTGSFSDANRKKMRLPDNLYTFGQDGFAFDHAYAEASVGVENIFSLLRVDGIWRLTHLNHPNISPFGVRATVQFGF